MKKFAFYVLRNLRLSINTELREEIPTNKVYTMTLFAM